MYEFEIPGEIVGKGRPRMNTYTGKAYTPTKTKNYEYLVRQWFVFKYPRFEMTKAPVRVTIIAYFDIPKSTSKKKTEQMLNNEIRPTKKPDIDNITKIILDALNKFVYQDDTQVIELIVKKYYANTPKVYVKVEEI